MASPMLETKLHVPGLRPGLVARSRLSERLRRGTGSTLTLVSAPAGFGKSTLLAEWMAAAAADGRAVAWLSLDHGDNDSETFWTYLITAVRTAAPDVGPEALSLLQSQSPVDAVLASLLNDLATSRVDVVLVLDDYHVIDAPDVQDAMAFLIEHLPPRVHLVIATRADPALPLARLRGRGELVEIRAADLRFTASEAAAYLNDAMGLTLTAPDIAALEGRTEGWIAALQLAALSMQGRDDVAGFIAGFAGDDRYIVDYLAEEVLQRQPESVHRFLLQTSILGRLCGPLCDAVTGQDDSKAVLAALERANLFLVPLDDRRHWYRYHHLFADVLRAHLLDEQPDAVADLHRRASAWFDQNGEPAEAVRHALDGADFERAADLVELTIPAMRKTRQEALIVAWLKLLPAEVLGVRPVLSVWFAGAMLANGEFETAGRYLSDAERWLHAPASSKMVVQDEAEFRRLPGAIEMYRAALAMTRGDAVSTATHARRAVELAPEDDHVGRASASGLVGLALWTSGDLEPAHQAWSECVAGLKRAGHVADVLGCSIALADIRLAQGRPGQAMRTYEQALHLAGESVGPVVRGTADMHVGMSEIHRERDELALAMEQLQRSQELGAHAELAQNPYRWRVAMARICEAEGDLAGALDRLTEAQRVYASDFFPNVRPIPAMMARVHIAQGAVDEALDWAREQGLSSAEDLSYLREFEHITLARALLAGNDSVPEATQLLTRLLRAAEAGERTRSVIEILMLQALAEQSQGDTTAALVALERAVTLAEPAGYVRIFVDEGAPMAALLRTLAKQKVAESYVRRLLLAFGPAEVSPSVPPEMIEPLSERELDVLRLLATDLDGPDIARALFVSLNTMRTHTKRIYTKLGVNTRRAAVRRAAELHL